MWTGTLKARVLVVVAAAILMGAAGSLSALWQTVAPDPAGPAAVSESELRDLVDRFVQDRSGLLRKYPSSELPTRAERLQRYYEDWAARLAAVPFEPLGVEGRIDYVALENQLVYERRLLDRDQQARAESADLVPFASTITDLDAARSRMETLDPVKAAMTLNDLQEEIARAESGVEGREPGGSGGLGAFRAQERLQALAGVLRSWFEFYAGYDPLFTWWADAPYRKVTAALDRYRDALRTRVLGIKAGEDEPIVGAPIGREALVADLASELIPYTPEDLLAVGERELAWCEAEMRKAAREMGFGDDWHAALEKVKSLHVPPGRQPDLIRDLAHEAEEYVVANDLITVPPLAREIWRMQMMSPERQKVNPFFTGGETISVSFPTASMDHDDKLMSMRGNNIHFARATVFHELIPGHHLQGFMTARYNSHRRASRTPFWLEGWSLYWEMLLWDRGFARSPEDRVGMLFWRMHRAARIIFSLRFHLAQWTPQECIDFLVERVGHERANADAEVRRSFNGSYPPLYQLAYMMGGFQFKALHTELVGGGRMTDRQFHDRIITGGTMPVELVRARLTGERLTRGHRASWKFLEDRQ